MSSKPVIWNCISACYKILIKATLMQTIPLYQWAQGERNPGTSKLLVCLSTNSFVKHLKTNGVITKQMPRQINWSIDFFLWHLLLLVLWSIPNFPSSNNRRKQTNKQIKKINPSTILPPFTGGKKIWSSCCPTSTRAQKIPRETIWFCNLLTLFFFSTVFKAWSKQQVLDFLMLQTQKLPMWWL